MKSVLKRMSYKMNITKKTTAGVATLPPDSQLQSHWHQCLQCDWSSQYRYNVKRHTRKQHWGQLRFECDLCPAVLGWSKTTLDNHMARVHKEKLVGCDQCEYRGHTENIVHTHRRQVHEKRWVRRVQCGRCGEVYASKYELEKHTLHIHEGVKRPSRQVEVGSWSCGLCPKVFEQKKYLDRHFRRQHHSY
ncbi:MAG: hypothetical protein GY738_27690 [Pseudoalteromonas sp.]|nr:hypothetical protein [Pseudoalteromonas sp.]